MFEDENYHYFKGNYLLRNGIIEFSISIGSSINIKSSCIRLQVLDLPLLQVHTLLKFVILFKNAYLFFIIFIYY